MDAVGTAHVGFAVASLVGGVGVFALRKGTNLHRAIGATYVLTMFGVNVTALLIYRLFGGFGAFHVLSIINLIGVLAGFGTVLLQRPRKVWLRWHYFFMGWSYVGLLAATASEISVRILAWPFVMAVAAPTIGVVLVGGAVVQLRERTTMRRIANRTRERLP